MKTNYFIMNKKSYVFLSEKGKMEYFVKINEKDITYNRKFWQTVRTFLSDKVKSKVPIIFVNNDNE